MIQQRKWDKFETALLIEAHIEIEKDKTKRTLILENLSKTLRKMAINQGIEIADIYRNYNGMNMQEGMIQYVFANNPIGLHHSKLFVEMVNLYKTNYQEFSLILQEAHKMINKEENITTELLVDNISSFKKWLESNKPKFSINNSLVSNISNYIISRKYAKNELFEIKDSKEFGILKNKVFNDSVFRHNFKKEYKDVVLLLNLYHNFLKSNSDKSGQTIIVNNTANKIFFIVILHPLFFNKKHNCALLFQIIKYAFYYFS